jgi:Conjugative relaxosome accessory transposon protein
MRYGVKMRVIAVLTVFSMLFSTTFAGASDWVGDWVNSYTYTGPNSFKSGTRTYMNGGSFHARWGDNSTEPIVTFQPPSIKGGCGGIDAFMGSFSFLDFGRLVQKFKKMSTGAVAAFAFDIALNVLCTPCSNALKALEALSNGLNSLQMGDCMSVKTIKASMTNFGKQMGVAEDQGLAALSNTAALFSGADYKDSDDKVKGNPITNFGSNLQAYWADLTADCNDVIKGIFQEEGSLLVKFSKDKSRIVLGNTDAYNMARAFVGDIYIKPRDNGIPLVLVQQPCEGNNSVDIEKIINGKYQIQTSQPGGSGCIDATPTGIYSGKAYTDGLKGLVHVVLKDIARETAIGYTTLSPSSERLLRETPAIPIGLIAAVAWRQPNANITTVEADLFQHEEQIARIIAFEAMKSLLGASIKSMVVGFEVVHNSLQNPNATTSGGTMGASSHPQTSNDSNKCNMDGTVQPQAAQIDNFIDQMRKDATTTYERMADKKTQEEMKAFADKKKEWEVIKAYAMEKFANHSVYSRVMSKVNAIANPTNN